jgi:hypothetical protein
MWRSEFEALPALAEEWTEGVAEEFVRDLESLVARKRALRELALKLAQEIKYVHVLHDDVLAFFDIETAYLHWSIMNCPSDEMDQAGLALAAWREVLEKYSGTFPPSEETCRSYAAMQIFLREAHSAAAMILAGFRSVDAFLAPKPVEPEQLQRAATDTVLTAVAA